MKTPPYSHIFPPEAEKYRYNPSVLDKKAIEKLTELATTDFSKFPMRTIDISPLTMPTPENADFFSKFMFPISRLGEEE